MGLITSVLMQVLNLLPILNPVSSMISHNQAPSLYPGTKVHNIGRTNVPGRKGTDDRRILTGSTCTWSRIVLVGLAGIVSPRATDSPA